jgi:hypothetical protein
MGYQPKPNYYSDTTTWSNSWESMVNALKGLGITSKEAANTISELNKYINSQLGPATPEKTENPKRKKALEILPRIEVSEEFLNLKVDN